MIAISKAALLTTFTALLLSAVLFAPMCQALEVGVQVGDWMKYEATILEWIAEPDVPFPPDFSVAVFYTFNETDWQKYTITDVTGSNVTFEVLSHWKNGTETTSTLENINITTAQVNWVIEANLESGDLYRDEFTLYGILDFPPLYLNDSIMVDYQNVTREANVLDYYQPTVFPEDSVHSRLLWDKETGVLVNSYQAWNNTSAFGKKYFIRYEIKLVDSNLWVIPESHTWTVMLLMATASTFSIVLYKRRRLFIKT